jgi:tetratricopeptide (TPR) repeat protein
MPGAATSDIPHVVTTLHGIPRHRDRATTASAGAMPDETQLVPFHRDLMSQDELREADRDLGVALRHKGEKGAAKALPLLNHALAERPDDILARESVGFAEWALGRDEAALATFEAVMKADPDRESTLEAAALIAGQLRHREQAIAYWRRAIAVDPWRSSFHAELAYQLTRIQRWDAAAESARNALRINPASHSARAVLALSTLRLGSPQEARAQFDTLLEFNPPDREGLIRWFSSLR